MNSTQALPKFMTREITCSFTGHRNIPQNMINTVSAKLEAAVAEHYKMGYRYFICGGAYGFDMLAEETLVKAMRRGSDVHLILALPCRNQTEKWSNLPDYQNLLRRYLFLKGFAESVYYIRDFYVDGCMKERNQFMIDHSSACIAYCDENVRGGSLQTVNMARRAKIRLTNLFGDSTSY